MDEKQLFPSYEFNWGHDRLYLFQVAVEFERALCSHVMP